MVDHFTARVCNVKSSSWRRAALVRLELIEGQLTDAVVLGVDTQGRSAGQLRPNERGVAAHVVLDSAFVRKLQPGNLLRVEWETRARWLMTNIVAIEITPEALKPAC